MSLRYLRILLSRPVDALPIDLFRVAVGLLLCTYFFRTFLQAPLFSGPDGLIDHKLSLDVFWFTKMGLFQPWMDLWVFQTVFLTGCLLSLFVAFGYRVKLSAALLYVIAISTYRWNFLVMYVDDAIMHLLIFWMLVLPVGRTLTLGAFLRDRKEVWNKWKDVQVPGFAFRCFIFNIALIYIVAGLWKWTSPMWRDGTALYVVLELPISFFYDFWRPEHLPFLKLFNHAALIIEPLVPFMFLLPKRHFAKYPLVIAFLGLHLGTVATLDIPFANIGCAAFTILIFREEIMDRLRGKSEVRTVHPAGAKIGFSGAIAAAMVITLTLAMLSSVTLPGWRQPTNAAANVASSHHSTEEHKQVSDGIQSDGLGPVQSLFFGALWCVGIAQQYQLFNWIDDRNFTVRYQIFEDFGDGTSREIDPSKMFPGSTRGVLLKFYLHGVTWTHVPHERRQEIRNSILGRLKRTYCNTYDPDGKIRILYELERIDPLGKEKNVRDGVLMEFSCPENLPR